MVWQIGGFEGSTINKSLISFAIADRIPKAINVIFINKTINSFGAA